MVQKRFQFWAFSCILSRRGIIGPMPAFVYILRCCDGTLYTGYTIDLERRFKQHQSGRGGRYTRTHRPVELVYSERLDSRRAAMQRELQVKRLSRKHKLELIQTGSKGKIRRNRVHTAAAVGESTPVDLRERAAK